MKIVNVGYNYKHPYDFCINRPYGSGDYMLLVLRSPAFFILKDKKQLSAPNSLIVFKKGTPQIYGASEQKFINDWIHFELDEKEVARMEELEIPFDTLIPVDNAVLFSDFVKSIFTECYSQSIYKETSLNLYFELILLKLSESIKSSALTQENRHFKMFSDLRNEIFLNPEKDWSIEYICSKISFSRSYVQHLYKSFFNKTIIEDVVSSRMEYAKYLLSGTDMTVSNVADACGYRNDVHFMRLFKDTVGVTPTQFRKQTHIAQDELERGKMQNPFCL